jgi:phosphatidylserine/phosphatidylglycerophosphate/cardiolipin synthase-like enzyme
MPEVIAPTWADLLAVISDATDRLRVVTPFYSEEGITQVLDHLGPQTFVAVTTKLSPPDWASGVADPIALEDLLDLLPGRHSLGIVQRLHGKAYIADRSHALIGSSNLSIGGFNRNVELMVRFRGSEAADALDAVEAACAGARPLALGDLSR